MSELYQILGVRPDAADKDIRAAFRRLAKQLHPDLNAGDADAGRRLREVIRAYETLGDPALRGTYDARLARRRGRARSRAVTMLTVFALTVTVGLGWRPLSEALRNAGDAAADRASMPAADPADAAGGARADAPDVRRSVALIAPSPVPTVQMPPGMPAAPADPDAREAAERRGTDARDLIHIMLPDDGAVP